LASINGVIRRIFPNGTNVGAKHADCSTCPRWPPDAFAVAGTLVELSGCYADVRYGGLGRGSLFRDAAFRKRIYEGGIAWRKSRDVDSDVSQQLDTLWLVLLDHGEKPVAAPQPLDEAAYECFDAAVTLMLMADEASTGMGFPSPGHLIDPLRKRMNVPDSQDAREAEAELDELLRLRQLAELVYRQYRRVLLRDDSIPEILPRPVESLCQMASNEEVVVQPKTTTAQTGMTLRSLTHHLALLPPRGEVSTRWILSPWSDEADDAPSRGEGRPRQAPDDPILNLMLVPFPYRIHGTAFQAGGTSINDDCVADRAWVRGEPNFFDLQQHWLQNQGADVKPSEMASFLGNLLTSTGLEAREVHGIIMPELALSLPLLDKLIPLLAQETTIEFFITGVLVHEPGHSPRNSVCMIYFSKSRQRPEKPWLQSKHHRWQLERSQIRRYHLGHALSTRTRWWEKIDVSNRYCNFFVFRPGASLAALVCEDLARVDPVQKVLRAVGPNLVVALLLDGPQLVGRWSHRYATVLAEDPGSAVLTLTAAGMVERSVDPGVPLPDKVALWRDARGAETLELSLPSDAHALLLSIETKYEEHKTLDGRSDNRATAALNLAGVRAIRHPSPPSWLRRG